MAAVLGYEIAAVITAFAAAFCLSVVGWDFIRRERSRGGSESDGRWFSRKLRNGIGCLMTLARALLRFPKVQSNAAIAVAQLEERSVTTSDAALLSVTMAFLLAGAGVVSFVTMTPLCGLLAIACAVGGAVAWLHGCQDKREQALREAVPDALRAMEVCFQSGYSLLQTFQQVSKETPDQMGRLFQKSANLLEVGQTASEALDVFRKQEGIPEMSFVAVTLDVQHQTGGSMAMVLAAARETVEGELELIRSLRVQTSQAKLSARIVSLMPLLLIMVFSLISKDFLAPFFESAIGMGMLAVAVTMQIAGVLLVRRMLKVEVG